MNASVLPITLLEKPAGYYVDSHTDTPQALERHTLKLILKGWDIQKKIAALQTELKDINSHFIQGYGAPAVLTMPGVCQLTITERTRCDALQDIASSADHPLSAPLRKLLTIGCQATVTWEKK